jgi:putative sterol carrier protein
MSLKSEKIFDHYKQILKEGSGNFTDLVKKVNGIFAFEVYKKKGDQVKIWTIDLKNGNGAVYDDLHGKPDCTFTVKDDDLIKMIDGKLSPPQAFISVLLIGINKN